MIDLLDYDGPGQTRERHLDHLSQGHVLVGHQVSRGLTGVTSAVTGGEYDHSMISLPLFDGEGLLVDAVMVTQAHRAGVTENRLSRYAAGPHPARIDWSIVDGLDVSAMIRKAAYLRDTPYGVATIAIHTAYETARRIVGGERAERLIDGAGLTGVVSALTAGTLICSQAVTLILQAGGWANPKIDGLPPWRVHPSRLAAALPAPSYSTRGGAHGS